MLLAAWNVLNSVVIVHYVTRLHSMHPCFCTIMDISARALSNSKGC